MHWSHAFLRWQLTVHVNKLFHEGRLDHCPLHLEGRGQVAIVHTELLTDQCDGLGLKQTTISVNVVSPFHP